MRFVTVTVLSAVALLSRSCVSGACVPGTIVPNQSVGVNPPTEGALTLFVLKQLLGTANFFAEDGSQDGITAATVTGTATGKITDGLLAADNICTYRAALSTQAKASFNRNAAGTTVQFKAVLSSQSIDAITRITPGVNIQSYKTLGNVYKCLAADRLDLFSASDNLGYDMNSVINDEEGNSAAANAGVWTSIGIPVPAKLVSTATAQGFGERYYSANANNDPPAAFDAAYAAKYTCNDWSTSSTGKGSVGIINASSGSGQNTWLQQATGNEVACSNGYRIYCISAQPFVAPTQPPGGAGDPQFTGLQGQSFQVHGMPEEFFNLITTPAFQLNSRFTYLASGNCNYNNTECWTHPGTYVDQLGFMFPGLQIKTVAGPHHKGMRVWVNEEEMHRSAGRLAMSTVGLTGTVTNSTVSEVTITHPHHDVVSVSFPLFTLDITNSDWFFNFNLVFHAPEVLAAGREMHFIADARASTKATNAHYLNKKHQQVYPEYPMHGLVGQTWRNARYPSKRMYQGEVDDYMLLDHQLFSTQFMYNIYQH